MSDNPMRLTASFADEKSAQKTGQILRQAQEWIFAATDEERYVREYLEDRGQTKGVAFSSFWVPNGKIECAETTLTLECVGSPGDDWPDDLVVWLGKQGARRVTGTLTISGTGDVVEIDEAYSG